MPGVVDDVSAVSENDAMKKGPSVLFTVPVTVSGLCTPLPTVGELTWMASTPELALCVQTLASCEGTVTPLPLQPASVSTARPTITPMAHIITLRIASAAPASEHPPPAKASAKMRWRAGVAQW